MIHPDKALKIIFDAQVNIKEETIKVIDSLNRVLSQDTYSEIDQPGFDKSAMDGYAYNINDDIDNFEVIEIIPAGHIPKMSIKKGQCSKIMTGAMVPEGANRVVKIEHTQEKNNKIYITEKDDIINICYKGENIKTGDKILDKGTLIRPQEIAALSTVGIYEIAVYKKPLVGIVTTGSELLCPGDKLEPGKIYDSNGPQLYNQIKTINVDGKYYGNVKDHKISIEEYFEKAISECDILVISGGVSKGDFDFVPEALENLGFEIKFHKIAVKPGKPILFAERNGKFVFGLPGNPVSTFVGFELFVKPLIYKCIGYNYEPITYKGKLASKITRKKAERVEYIPVCFDGEIITPVDYHGSGHINALSKTNALVRLEQNVYEIDKSSIVNVRQI